MANHKNHLSRAYQLDGPEATIHYYDDWADTYDDELQSNGYVTPFRCAEALAQYASDFEIPVLDIGCGTGVSGKALKKSGFSNINGADVSERMLNKAVEQNIYKDTWLMDPENPFPFNNGTYAAITAVGVIGTGAAPVQVLYAATGKITSGGLFVLSLNDHALAASEFPNAIEDCQQHHGFEMLFNEYGPHITGKDMKSRVYVLRKI